MFSPRGKVWTDESDSQIVRLNRRKSGRGLWKKVRQGSWLDLYRSRWDRARNCHIICCSLEIWALFRKHLLNNC